MKKQLFIYLFFIGSISLTSLCMEGQKLTQYDPKTTARHERALKRGTSSTLAELTNAVAYFESTTDLPQKDERLSKRLEWARTTLIPHLEREEKFKTILALEQTAPDKTRWPEIVLLLDKLGYFLPTPSDITDQLMVLCERRDKSYEAWRAIIKPLMPSTPPVMRSEPQIEEAPSLPPFLIHNASQEDQTSDQDDTEEDDEEEESDHNETPQSDSADATPAKQPAVQKKGSKQGRVFIPKKKKNNKKGKQGKGKKKKSAQSKQAQQKLGPVKRFWDALTAKNAATLRKLLTEHKNVLDANMRHVKLDKPALHLAVMLEDPALCAVLLEHGARPRETSLLKVPFFTQPLRVSALALAVHARSTEIVDMLLNEGADPNQPIMCQNVEAEHILCLAATESHIDPKYTPELQERMIRRLLLGGARTPCKSIVLVDLERDRSWPIDLEKEIYQECIELIVECTKEIKCVNNAIVLFADSQALTDVLEDQKDNKDEHIPTQLATHLLWHALEQQDENQACALLQNIQDPTLLTSASEYCHLGMLHYCVINHLTGLCRLFLDRGADPNGIVEVTVKSDDEQSQEILQVTPLTFAILNGHVDLATLLKERGADLNKMLVHLPEEVEEYPLCSAIASLQSTNPDVSLSSRKQMIKFLFMNGATDCTRNILMFNTQTNSKSPLDPRDATDLAIIRLLLEDDNFEECMEYYEEGLILKTSVEAYAPDEIGFILGSSNEQELSE